MNPVVAIVGRPNVGKSTLFNRITGGRKALTLELPGMTRDRNYATAEWSGYEFICVDTGGFPGTRGAIEEKIEEQIRFAIDEANLVICLFDGEAGVCPGDREIVCGLRKSGKKVFFVVNKIDIGRHEVLDFYQMGISEIFPVSAEHGYQVAELLDRVVEEIRRLDTHNVTSKRNVITPPLPPLTLRGGRGSYNEKTSDVQYIAVVGRPNVGKSSLVNVILGAERVVVDKEPGTTRDSIDTTFHTDGGAFCLIDTAGIRKHGRTGPHLERLTVMRSLAAIDKADVCLLVVDASCGLLKQDAHIASYIADAGKGLIVLWNKTDLVSGSALKALRENSRKALPFLPKVPLHLISARERIGTSKILPSVRKIFEECGRFVDSGLLKERFLELTSRHSAPFYKGKEVRLFSITQAGAHPPTFVIGTNAPDGIDSSYKRYLTRGLQESLDLKRVPVRVVFRRRRA